MIFYYEASNKAKQSQLRPHGAKRYQLFTEQAAWKQPLGPHIDAHSAPMQPFLSKWPYTAEFVDRIRIGRRGWAVDVTCVPTREQLEWADCELGAIFHYDITVFEQDYRFRRSWGYQPSPQIFAPDALDTDQWIRAVAKAGVRYAVLVAKHCTGFALFPSSANPYHVAIRLMGRIL